MIAAVLYDLDDTLYPQADFLAAAWDAVADVGAGSAGVPRDELRSALGVIAAEGSDRGRIIDRALERLGVVDVDVAPMVATFLSATPAVLTPYPGAFEAVARMRSRVPVGLVTDGAPDVQRAKLRALGAEELFDAVVLSDEIGREHRKPDPAPFLAAARALGVDPTEVVMIGDRPDKDVVGAASAGMRCVRVMSGEYVDRPDTVEPWARVEAVGDAFAVLADELPAAR